jgi:DNA-binding CsgD family transcriptional regulator
MEITAPVTGAPAGGMNTHMTLHADLPRDGRSVAPGLGDRAVDLLVGRQHELAVIGAFLEAAGTGGATLLLTGEPGVGKTALLDAAAVAGSGAGLRVLQGGGVAAENEVGFAGLHQLLHPVLEDLDRVPAPSRAALDVALGLRPGPDPAPMQVLHGCLALLGEVAARTPLLLLVDDVQLLDGASRTVLGFVGRRVGGHRIGVLAATRAEFGRSCQRSDFPRLEVAPLTDDEAMRLLTRTFPHLPGRTLRSIAHDAQGSPLALLEFGAAAGSPRSGGRRRSTGTTAGPSRDVLEFYAARVRALPTATRRLLLLAAVDASGTLAVLDAASGGEALGQLAAAEHDRLVVTDEVAGAIRFGHPLTRAAVLELSTLDERRAAHQSLAEAFRDRPERRAHHLAEAAVVPDRAIADAIDAGARLTWQRGDVVGAIAGFRRAAELSPDRAERNRRHAQAAYLGVNFAGELDSWSQLLGTSLHDGARPSLQAAVASAILVKNTTGNVETAHRLLGTAIQAALAEDAPDPVALAQALSVQLEVCHYADRADYWATFHRDLHQLTGGAPAQVALLAAGLDPLAASTEELQELRDRAAVLGECRDPWTIIGTAQAAVHLDLLPDCRAALERVLLHGEDGGGAGAGVMALLLCAVDDLDAGRWAAAEDRAADALALCEQHGFRLYEWTAHHVRARIAALRGDRAACVALCTELLQWAAPRRLTRLSYWAHLTLARSALGHGDFEQAYLQATALSPPGVLPAHNPEALLAAFDLVEAAQYSGRTAEARVHATAVREAGLARLSPRFALTTAAAIPMAAPEDQLVERFEEALALPGAAEFPFELGRVHLVYGERLRRLGRHRAARAHLAAARDDFERLGARSWAARAETQLRATGPTRMRDRRPGAAALTPQEAEVVRLAADGLSNREIAARLVLSPRTVSSHLYRAFPKLGVTSRAALGRALGAPPQEDRRLPLG